MRGNKAKSKRVSGLFIQPRSPYPGRTNSRFGPCCIRNPEGKNSVRKKEGQADSDYIPYLK